MRKITYKKATVDSQFLHQKICKKLVALCEKYKDDFRPNTGKSRRFGINGEASEFHMCKFYMMPRELKEATKQLMPPSFKGRINELWYLTVRDGEEMFPFKGAEHSFFNIHSIALSPAKVNVDGTEYDLKRGDMLKFALNDVHSVPSQKGVQHFMVAVVFPDPINV